MHPESRTAEPAVIPWTNDVPAARSRPADGAPAEESGPVGRTGPVGPEPEVPRLGWRFSLPWSMPFRLPTDADPAPPTGRIVAMTAWAALLTLVGVAVGARAFAGMLFTPGLPVWFEPAVIGAGLVSIALTTGALASIQHRQLPWLLLPGATAALGIALILTTIAL